jgi:hypothetical protein
MHYRFPSGQKNCSCFCSWRHTAAPQATERTQLCIAQSSSVLDGLQWRRISWYLRRTVCTVFHYSQRKDARPLSTQLHATKPNEILHFDLQYIGWLGNGKHQYILLLEDDLSGYQWLFPCRTAGAAAIFDALMRWFAVFRVVLL